MKRKELVRYLMQNGCTLSREGGKYSIFSNPVTGKEIPVTRHTEIADFTVRKICKELGLEPPR
ncbi:MAG TPA: type II toxin-antitoxin system HicA family toxin [Elusimicrobiales bacterium]|nr:type II toxin-antitoxin system HicA family toxin [Elusimicrobiales bacterium]